MSMSQHNLTNSNSQNKPSKSFSAKQQSTNRAKMALSDYEIVTPLNYELNMSVYKAKKGSGIYVLYSVEYTKIEPVLKKIEERRKNSHPNLMEFIEVFEAAASEVDPQNLYFTTDFYSNGNLTEILASCKRENKHLGEELICRILYQVLCALKTIPQHLLTGKLNLHNIFLDDDFNVKLFHFDPTSAKKTVTKTKICHLGALLYSLCTLNLSIYDKCDTSQLRKLYSVDLEGLLNYLLKDTSYLSKTLDKVLCNATILLKCSQWKKERSFFALKSKTEDIETAEDYLLRAQELRIKEANLNEREAQLAEREQKLVLRERKVELLEQMLKDKMKALKREEFDESFAGDSVINVVTSKKLDENFARPFNRSKSEIRRVKFKGHSPLRDMNSHHSRNRSSQRAQRIRRSSRVFDDKENKSHDTISEKSTNSGGSCGASKKLFEQQAEPGKVWTDESKKHAFEMLRIMNGAIEKGRNNNPEEIKHTYL